MQDRRAHRLLSVGLAASLLFGAAACGSDDDTTTTEAGQSGDGAITSLEDLAGKTIGVQTGTTGET